MIIKGTFLDTPKRDTLRVRTGYLTIDGIYCGQFYENLPDELDTSELYDYSNKLIIPGITDLHLHAPQYSYCGTAMDVELLDWLNNYTYPEEARYADISYAVDNYSIFVNDLRNSATTRACIFASLHTDATLELMKQLESSGLISYVGKLNMNRNSPDYYREASTSEGISETLRWIAQTNSLSFKNTHAIITPRFTPSVSDDYMQALGKVAKDYSIPCQSHLSENLNEINWVKELCPTTDYYAQSYYRYGLFGGSCPTVMAHCIMSENEEKKLIKDQGVYIAHCPTSNENVIAGIAPAAHYLRNGYKIGLGSDVAGGHTLNMFAVMSAAVQCSKLRYRYIDNSDRPISIVEALYMATVGGGSFFGKTGLFEPGYEFDSVVFDLTPIKNNRNFSPEELLERYSYLGNGVAEAKFIQGRKII